MKNSTEATTTFSELIGRACFYRPQYERNMAPARITDFEEYENLEGAIVVYLVLDNGIRVSPTEVYFSRASIA